MDNFILEQQKLNPQIGEALKLWTSGETVMTSIPPPRTDAANGTPKSTTAYAAAQELPGETDVGC